MADIPSHLGPHPDTLLKKSPHDVFTPEPSRSTWITNPKNNTQTELTANQLNSWLLGLEKGAIDKESKAFDPEFSQKNPSILLGYFGLQEPEEVIEFLETPAGETVKEMIGTELAEIAARDAHRQFELQEEQKQQEFMMAFMLMMAAKHHAEKKSHLNELLQEDIDSHLHHKQAPDSHGMTAAGQEKSALEESLKAYDQKTQEINQKIEEKHHQLHQHDKKGQSLEEKGQLIENRYNELENRLAEVNKLDAESAAEQLPELEDRISELNKQITSEAEQIAQDLDNAQTEDDELEIRRRLENVHAMQLESAALQERVDVLKEDESSKEKSTLYDKHGNEVSWFDDAKYIAAAGKKLLKDEEGKLLLVDKDKNLEDLSADEKSKAKDAFNHSKNEMTVLSKVVEKNKKAEIGMHAQEVQSHQKVRSDLESELGALNNQLSGLASAKATAQAALNNINNPSAAPTPAPSSSSSLKSSAAKNQVSSASQRYQQVMSSIKKDPTESGQKALQRYVMENYGNSKYANPNNMQGFRPGVAINPNFLAYMMKRFEALGTVEAQRLEGTQYDRTPNDPTDKRPDSELSTAPRPGTTPAPR